MMVVNSMKEDFWKENPGKTIDKYALVLTLIAVGVFLQFNPEFILSKDITGFVRVCCFGIAAVALIFAGRKLEHQKIFGVPEIALGSVQMYILANTLPSDGGWGILFLFSIAWFFFYFVGGFIALMYSTIRKYGEEKTPLFSKIESIVASFTALLTALFAGIQIFVQ